VVFDNPDGVPVTVTGNGQTVTYLEGGGTAGLAISESSVTLSDLTVADMSDSWLIPGDGGKTAFGAITNGSQLTINNSTVEDNIGGGIWNQYGSGTYGLGGFGSEGGTGSSQLTINDSIVEDNINTTENSSGNGGGIWNDGSTVTINDSTVNYNTAGDDGGGIYNGTWGRVFITDSAVDYNTAGDDGGGIWNDGLVIGPPSSTVEGNIAGGHGGGVYNQAFGGFHVGLGGPPNPGGIFGGFFGPGPVVTGNSPDNVYNQP